MEAIGFRSPADIRSEDPHLQRRAPIKALRGTVSAAVMFALASCGYQGKKEVEITPDMSVGIASASIGTFNETEAASLYLKLTPKGVEAAMRRQWKAILQEKAQTLEQIASIPQTVSQLVAEDMKTVPKEGITTIEAYEIMGRNSMAKETILEAMGIVGYGTFGFLIAKALPGVNLRVSGVSQSEATGGDSSAIAKGGGASLTIKHPKQHQNNKW